MHGLRVTDVTAQLARCSLPEHRAMVDKAGKSVALQDAVKVLWLRSLIPAFLGLASTPHTARCRDRPSARCSHKRRRGNTREGFREVSVSRSTRVSLCAACGFVLAQVIGERMLGILDA